MPRQTLYSVGGDLPLIDLLDHLSEVFDYVLFSRAEGRKLVSRRIEKLTKLLDNSKRHTDRERSDVLAAQNDKDYTLIQVWNSEKPEAKVQFYYARAELCGLTFSEGVPPRSRRAYANRIAKAAGGEVQTVAEDY